MSNFSVGTGSGAAYELYTVAFEPRTAARGAPVVGEDLGAKIAWERWRLQGAGRHTVRAMDKKSCAKKSEVSNLE